MPVNISSPWTVDLLEGQLRIEVGPRRAVIRRRGSGVLVRLDVWRIQNLSVEDAKQAVQAGQRKQEVLVVFDRASMEAREVLRAVGLSYVSVDGEAFLALPQIIVDVAPKRNTDSPKKSSRDARDEVFPFAKRAGRVARWLLLHAQKQPTISELAEYTELSQPFVSQVAHALHDRALVELITDPSDARIRRVHLISPVVLADSWSVEWVRRRRREATWDIGTVEIDDTLTSWLESAKHAGQTKWALGGLAGAWHLVRAVEPEGVLIWIDPADLSRWEDLLIPKRVSPGRAPLRVASAPDPWTLNLTWTDNGIPIADPAQLYLDCMSSGERALEAAAAIKRKVGW